MKASVIIPAYNAEKTLERTLRSVMTQSERDLEIVVVNDGSSDGTADVIARIAAEDPRMVAVDKDNGGLSSARNAGLKVAQGEVIFFVDADDMLHPDGVKAMLGLLCQRVSDGEKADVAVGRFERVDREPSERLEAALVAKDIRMLDSREAVRECLYQQIANSVCVMAFRREMFERHPELRFVEGLTYEDLEFSVRMFATVERVVVADLPYYYYFYTPGSIINVFNRRRLDVLKITSEIENRYKGDAELSKAAADRRFSACFNIFLLANRDSEYADVAAECWREIESRRIGELVNREVRLKNKLGALLSYAGRRVVSLVGRYISQ